MHSYIAIKIRIKYYYELKSDSLCASMSTHSLNSEVHSYIQKLKHFAYTMKIIIVYLDIMDCNSMLKLAHSLSFIKIKIVISLSNVVVASTYYGITSLDSFIHKFSRLYFMLVAKQL